MKRLRKYTAEFLGTFALVFVGCGAIVVDGATASIGHIGVSAVFGLIIMTMIYAFGNVSGAHFNPAVTLAFFAAKRICTRSMFLYTILQIAGAMVASLLLSFLFPETISLGATNPSGTIWQAFVLEVVLTFLLMTTILNVSTGHMEKGIMAGIAIGGYIALAAIFGGPISGASMNPARSIGPAVVSGDLQNLWIYITAPIVGALAAIPCFLLVQGGNKESANNK